MLSHTLVARWRQLVANWVLRPAPRAIDSLESGLGVTPKALKLRPLRGMLRPQTVRLREPVMDDQSTSVPD